MTEIQSFDRAAVGMDYGTALQVLCSAAEYLASCRTCLNDLTTAPTEAVGILRRRGREVFEEYAGSPGVQRAA